MTASGAVEVRRARTRRRRRNRHSWSPIRTFLVALLAGLYVYPFVFMAATALKPTYDYLANPANWPTRFTLEHFRNAWFNAGLGHALLNSLIASSIAVVVACVICSAAAFWFLQNPGRIAGFLLASFGSLWMIPVIVWIIPLFVLIVRLHLTDNLFVLGLVYGSVFAPGSLWLVWAYFQQAIPPELLQAAEVDGASQFQLYRSIVLPLSRPALAVVAVLTFILAWGDLIIAVILLQDTRKFTVVAATALLISRLNPAVQDTTAAAVITAVPTILVFLVAQKAIVRGITGGFSR